MPLTTRPGSRWRLIWNVSRRESTRVRARRPTWPPRVVRSGLRRSHGRRGDPSAAGRSGRSLNRRKPPPLVPIHSGAVPAACDRPNLPARSLLVRRVVFGSVGVEDAVPESAQPARRGADPEIPLRVFGERRDAAVAKPGVLARLKIVKRTPSKRARPPHVPSQRYPSRVWAMALTEFCGRPSRVSQVSRPY